MLNNNKKVLNDEWLKKRLLHTYVVNARWHMAITVYYNHSIYSNLYRSSLSMSIVQQKLGIFNNLPFYRKQQTSKKTEKRRDSNPYLGINFLTLSNFVLFITLCKSSLSSELKFRKLRLNCICIILEIFNNLQKAKFL